MCDPVSMAVANFGIKAVGAYSEYQGQKKAAQAQAAANDRAARDANIAYGEDLTRLEAERIVANEKSARETFEAKRNKLDALATAQANAAATAKQTQPAKASRNRNSSRDTTQMANSLATGLQPGRNLMQPKCNRDATGHNLRSNPLS